MGGFFEQRFNIIILAAVSEINCTKGGRLQGLNQGDELLEVPWTREGGEKGEKIFLGLNVQCERNQETLQGF